MIFPFRSSANLFKSLAHPARLAILSLLRDGEHCVCHMEAVLKLRQASISQHLRVLKDAGIVSDRRDGWNMFYRVTRPEVFEISDAVFALTGQPEELLQLHSKDECPCPRCYSEDVQMRTAQVRVSSE